MPANDNQPPRRPPLRPFYNIPGLFGDGPPHWPVKGKKQQRPSQTAMEAARQRDEYARKLQWHGKRNRDQTALDLKSKLLSCDAPQYPCLSGACPICIRAQQRLLVIATTAVVIRW